MTGGLNTMLDDIGLGKYQYLQTLIIGGIKIADGSEILMCSAVLGALQEAWHLTHHTKAFMMSLIFIGGFLGNLVGGSLADEHGRRVVVLVASFGICLFGVLSAFAWNPASMMVMRFLFGISFGMGVGPGVALQVESAPSRWRGHLVNVQNIFFAAGELYTALLLLIFMPTLQDPEGIRWRQVTLLTMVPGIMMMPFAILLLQESPHYLMTKGRLAEANAVITYIARMNGKEDAISSISEEGSQAAVSREQSMSSEQPTEGSPLLQESPKRKHVGRTAWKQLQTALGPEFRLIVIGGAYMCFLANFLFYGLTYGLPQTFANLHANLRPALQVVGISFSDLPGVVLSLFLLQSKRLGHRDGLLLLVGLSMVLQLSLMSIDFGMGWNWLGLLSAYVSKLVSSCLFTLIYVYLGEVFPSIIRCTGISICIAFGRIGSVLAPLLFEELIVPDHPIGPHAIFLMFNSGLCFIALFVIRVFLFYEMKNAPLEDLSAPPCATACPNGASDLLRRLSLSSLGGEGELTCVRAG